MFQILCKIIAFCLHFWLPFCTLNCFLSQKGQPQHFLNLFNLIKMVHNFILPLFEWVYKCWLSLFEDKVVKFDMFLDMRFFLLKIFDEEYFVKFRDGILSDFFNFGFIELFVLFQKSKKQIVLFQFGFLFHFFHFLKSLNVTIKTLSKWISGNQLIDLRQNDLARLIFTVSFINSVKT